MSNYKWLGKRTALVGTSPEKKKTKMWSMLAMVVLSIKITGNRSCFVYSE